MVHQLIPLLVSVCQWFWLLSLQTQALLKIEQVNNPNPWLRLVSPIQLYIILPKIYGQRGQHPGLLKKRALKQDCKRLKCKLQISIIFYLHWHECLLNYKCALSATTAAHFFCLINDNEQNSTFLWQCSHTFLKSAFSSCSPFKAFFAVK